MLGNWGTEERREGLSTKSANNTKKAITNALCNAKLKIFYNLEATTINALFKEAEKPFLK